MGLWLIKCLVILISIMGYVSLFGRFFKKVPLLYIPIGTISILANVLLISGYIGILGSASFLLSGWV